MILLSHGKMWKFSKWSTLFHVSSQGFECLWESEYMSLEKVDFILKNFSALPIKKFHEAALQVTSCVVCSLECLNITDSLFRDVLTPLKLLFSGYWRHRSPHKFNCFLWDWHAVIELTPINMAQIYCLYNRKSLGNPALFCFNNSVPVTLVWWLSKFAGGFLYKIN